MLQGRPKQQKTKTHRLQIWMDEELLKAIRKAANAMGTDVSNWARITFKEKIEKGKG